MKLDPHNARAHFHLGLALHDRGQSQSAVAHLNEAIRLRPDRCPDVVANGLDSGDESGSFGSRWSAGGRIGEAGNPAFRGPRSCAPWMHSPLRWPKPSEFAAAVDAAEQASTMALTRGNDAALADAIDAADAPLPPGLAVSPARAGGAC